MRSAPDGGNAAANRCGGCSPLQQRCRDGGHHLIGIPSAELVRPSLVPGVQSCLLASSQTWMAGATPGHDETQRVGIAEERVPGMTGFENQYLR